MPAAGLRGGAATGMPVFGAVLVLPAELSSSVRVRRMMNRAGRMAAKDTLMEHWENHMDARFRQDARTKFAHEPRKRPYKKIKDKVFRSRTDLVKTGRTKFWMTTMRPRIRIRSKTGNFIIAEARLKFPFPTGKVKPNVNVTPEKMAKEIEAWAPNELHWATKTFNAKFRDNFMNELRNSPRLRRQFGAIL